jgi:predicted sulfurtransferase
VAEVKRPFGQYARSNKRDDRTAMPKSLEDIAATPCDQCGKPMGFEIFLGPVCGKCCRENHRRVTRRGMHSTRSNT